MHGVPPRNSFQDRFWWSETIVFGENCVPVVVSIRSLTKSSCHIPFNIRVGQPSSVGKRKTYDLPKAAVPGLQRLLVERALSCFILLRSRCHLSTSACCCPPFKFSTSHNSATSMVSSSEERCFNRLIGLSMSCELSV